MKLNELFQKIQLNELQEYLDPNQYGGWINVDGRIENTPSHEVWLDSTYGDLDAYQKAFSDGWIRTINSRQYFNIQGSMNNIRRTFRYWWPTAIQSRHVYIDDENHDKSKSKRYTMPNDKFKLQYDFGSKQKTINEAEYSGKGVQLPDDVIKAFIRLGDLQRGEPEVAMLKVQHLMGGGVLNPVVEHTGDLTHRMSHMAKYGNMGYEFVKEKIEKISRYLKNLYGFEREYKENVQNNAKYRKQSPEELQHKLNIALKKYAQEHKKLPVYNKMQWLAREAAISVGEQNFATAEKYIDILDRYTNNRNRFDIEASKFYRDANGKLKQYEYGLEESIIKEEKIVQAAFKDPKTGKIYPTGQTHDFEPVMKDYGFNSNNDADLDKFTKIYNTLIHGFITDKGKFFDRYEAAKLIKSPEKILRTELIKGMGPNTYWKKQGTEPEIRENGNPLDHEQLIGLWIHPTGKIIDTDDWSLAHASTFVDYLKSNDLNGYKNLNYYTDEKFGKSSGNVGEFDIIDYALDNGWIRILEIQSKQSHKVIPAIHIDVKKNKTTPKALSTLRRLISKAQVDQYFINNRQISDKSKAIQALNNNINESPVWDLGGYWIADDGEILNVDHNNDIHHADLALSKYKDYIDTSHLEPHSVGEYIRDLARETAMDDGWIQVSTSTKELGVLFKPHKIKKVNLKKLIRLIKQDQEYNRYVFDVGRFTTEYSTKREAIRYLGQFLT